MRVPQQDEIDVVTPPETAAIDDVGARLSAVCSSPVGSEPLSTHVGGHSSVLILMADLTRSKASESLLPLVVTHLKEIGAHPSNISVLVARGTHRKLSKEERQSFRRPELTGIAVHEHDSDDADSMGALLLTTRGTPVRVNNAVREADVVILLSSISFHYFAGFGGGRKLVLPGCSDRAAIMANHRLSLVDAHPVTLHPNCQPALLEGNPVHEDMLEPIEALEGLFAINFFSNADGEVAYLNAGDVVQSHAEACSAYRDVYRVPVAQPYDVLIVGTGGYPYDLNLLQSHKALRHGSYAVKPGGTILFFAECEEGIGSPSLEAAMAKSREEFLDSAYEDYGLNNQTAVSLLSLTERFEVGMVSSVNVDTLLACGIRSVVNPESFLADALERSGANRVAVLEQGNTVLPYVKSEGGR